MTDALDEARRVRWVACDEAWRAYDAACDELRRIRVAAVNESYRIYDATCADVHRAALPVLPILPPEVQP